MRILTRLAALLLSLALVGCTRVIDFAKGIKTIKASGVVITEAREVRGFSGIALGTIGQLNLRQGDTESLTVRGSDNVVPLITTVVRDGVLVIDAEGHPLISGVTDKNRTTFDIVLKDLTALTVSGIGAVDMPALSTTDLAVTMSGTGKLSLAGLKADSLHLVVSGLGDVKLSGEVGTARATLSGMGDIDAPDLRIGTADVTISGAGNATVFVTERLTGEISGAGSISYYGAPQLDTQTSGAGTFKGLGKK